MNRLKKRWDRSGKVAWDDFFPKVPVWLRIKRFLAGPLPDTDVLRGPWTGTGDRYLHADWQEAHDILEAQGRLDDEL